MVPGPNTKPPAPVSQKSSTSNTTCTGIAGPCLRWPPSATSSNAVPQSVTCHPPLVTRHSSPTPDLHLSRRGFFKSEDYHQIESNRKSSGCLHKHRQFLG